jgi:small Trp-rich protein
MWLIWIGVALMALHFAGIGPFAGMDYWWMLPFGLAFVWFEFIERPFGLDRKKAHDELDRAKRKRIRLALGDKAQSVRQKSKPRK